MGSPIRYVGQALVCRAELTPRSTRGRPVTLNSAPYQLLSRYQPAPCMLTVIHTSRPRPLHPLLQSYFTSSPTSFSAFLRVTYNSPLQSKKQLPAPVMVASCKTFVRTSPRGITSVKRSTKLHKTLIGYPEPWRPDRRLSPMKEISHLSSPQIPMVGLLNGGNRWNNWHLGFGIKLKFFFSQQYK